MNPRILRKTLVSAVAGATLSSPVFAQNVLEEVVVVAQKREQNLQEVPIAINAFTGQANECLRRVGELRYCCVLSRGSYLWKPSGAEHAILDPWRHPKRL